MNAAPAPKTIQVSSHALVRWMERVVGADVDAVRADILQRMRSELGSDAPRAIGDADLVEYMEGHGFNLEPMRQKIRALCEPAAICGSPCVVAPDGKRLVLNGWVVVTVLDKGMQATRSHLRLVEGGRRA